MITRRRPFNPMTPVVWVVGISPPVSVALAVYGGLQRHWVGVVVFILLAAAATYVTRLWNPWVYERGSWKRAVGK